MRIVVLGSTGPTGRRLIAHALAAHHEVTAVARRPEAIVTRHDRLHVVRGDVLDPASLDGVFENADAVLSAIGSHSGRTPTTVYSQGMANIRPAMIAAGVRRIVVLSGAPVSPSSEKGFLERFIVHPLLRLFLAGGYADLRAMETDLRDVQDVDWTVFRPPRLTNGTATGNYRTAVEEALPGARSITRADLAVAMFDALDDSALIYKIVNIAA